jgi:hypothetical protein
MKRAFNFTADCKAYLASQKKSQPNRGLATGIENFELVSQSVTFSVAGAGPCNDYTPDFSGAGPCNDAPKAIAR